MQVPGVLFLIDVSYSAVQCGQLHSATQAIRTVLQQHEQSGSHIPLRVRWSLAVGHLAVALARLVLLFSSWLRALCHMLTSHQPLSRLISCYHVSSALGTSHELLSPFQIGIITFDTELHFYNLSPQLNQPQMLVVSDIEDAFVPLDTGLVVDVKEVRVGSGRRGGGGERGCTWTIHLCVWLWS
jgi:hypothetical protein